ncbi:helix-turn-helix transcriptional regulator [[Flexibacter] sp. ATCC 35208]|uniref:helix-turn-helix transcriptional regulator n=1 Tax=[Flexibacter] sp. ATCC 35208 TaxID=1936242 RepID=UPI0009CE7D67|nr:helix-turn-helix transcriptional regulator [[Flexibacter] sp. ATCC 35208]OMP77075.1 transcriptional regulator [[Flexibacter] sp. ATCC 35208]
MTITSMPEKVHQGRAVKRLREILHVKQDVLADALNISQQSVSLLETKETIEPEQLELIAKTLKVPVDAIKNFNEEAQIYNIQNNYEGASYNKVNEVGIAYNCTFNALDKWAEAMEEIKKLNAALLKEKDEKIAMLEKLLGEKKK